MGAKRAAMARKRFHARETVIPAHYATFGPLAQTPDKFIAGMKSAKTNVVVPERGQPVGL